MTNTAQKIETAEAPDSLDIERRVRELERAGWDSGAAQAQALFEVEQLFQVLAGVIP